MIRKIALSTTALAGAIALPLTFAAAQETNEQAQVAAQPQPAEQCLADLNTMSQRMQQDQFWLTGWGYGNPAMTDPAAPAAQDTAAAPATGPQDPRGNYDGAYTTRQQITALYNAARVLAYQGEQEGCAYVVGQLNDVYDGHVQQLTQAGVDPAAVTTWRAEQTALAQPIGEAAGVSSFRLDDLTGTDVRNPQDEGLGTISDVLIEPTDGSVSYVLVARGGFLGIGEEHIAIPWRELRATPGLEVIVVDKTRAELNEVPAVDPDRFRNPSTMAEERGPTDEYWSRQG